MKKGESAQNSLGGRNDMQAVFDDSLITGNKMIDTQHKELIDRINKLLILCENEKPAKREAVETLDYLADYTEFHFGEEEKLQEEMLVLCNFSEARLDALLQGMRRSGIRIALKAMLTESNAGWTFLQLYEELLKEHAIMTNAAPFSSKEQ